AVVFPTRRSSDLAGAIESCGVADPIHPLVRPVCDDTRLFSRREHSAIALGIAECPPGSGGGQIDDLPAAASDQPERATASGDGAHDELALFQPAPLLGGEAARSLG